MLPSNLSLYGLETRQFSDFDDGSIDYYVELDNRALNFFGLLDRRIQFPKVRGILLRVTSISDRYTVIFLGNIDINSQICNFELDNRLHSGKLEADDGVVNFSILIKNERE